MRKSMFIALLLGLSAVAHADGGAESWSVDGKVFSNKSQAIRYVMTLGKRVEIQHTRCEILTNKLTFKACPKNKTSSFENEQFEGLKVSK